MSEREQQRSERRLRRRLRRDPVERRIARIVSQLDAEEMTIEVNYDTQNRHWSMRWPPEWTVNVAWCERGWRNHPSEERHLSGWGHTLTQALDGLQDKVNSSLFREAVPSVGLSEEDR